MISKYKFSSLFRYVIIKRRNAYKPRCMWRECVTCNKMFRHKVTKKECKIMKLYTQKCIALTMCEICIENVLKDVYEAETNGILLCEYDNKQEITNSLLCNENLDFF